MKEFNRPTTSTSDGKHRHRHSFSEGTTQEAQKDLKRRNSSSTFEEFTNQEKILKNEITTQERALNYQIEQRKNTLVNIDTLESSLKNKSIQLLKDLAYLHEEIGQTEVERILVEREQNKTIEKLLEDKSIDFVDDRFKMVENLYEKVMLENNNTTQRDPISNIMSHAETKYDDFKAIEKYESNLGEAPQQAALEYKKLSDLQNKTEPSQTTHSPTNFYNSLTTNSNPEIQAAIKLVQDPLTSQDRDSFYKSIMESIKTGQATDTVGISGEPSYPTAIRNVKTFADLDTTPPEQKLQAYRLLTHLYLEFLRFFDITKRDQSNEISSSLTKIQNSYQETSIAKQMQKTYTTYQNKFDQVDKTREELIEGLKTIGVDVTEKALPEKTITEIISKVEAKVKSLEQEITNNQAQLKQLGQQKANLEWTPTREAADTDNTDPKSLSSIAALGALSDIKKRFGNRDVATADKTPSFSQLTQEGPTAGVEATTTNDSPTNQKELGRTAAQKASLESALQRYQNVISKIEEKTRQLEGLKTEVPTLLELEDKYNIANAIYAEYETKVLFSEKQKRDGSFKGLEEIKNPVIEEDFYNSLNTVLSDLNIKHAINLINASFPEDADAMRKTNTEYQNVHEKIIILYAENIKNKNLATILAALAYKRMQLVNSFVDLLPSGADSQFLKKTKKSYERLLSWPSGFDEMEKKHTEEQTKTSQNLKGLKDIICKNLTEIIGKKLVAQEVTSSDISQAIDQAFQNLAMQTDKWQREIQATSAYLNLKQAALEQANTRNQSDSTSSNLLEVPKAKDVAPNTSDSSTTLEGSLLKELQKTLKEARDTNEVLNNEIATKEAKILELEGQKSSSVSQNELLRKAVAKNYRKAEHYKNELGKLEEQNKAEKQNLEKLIESLKEQNEADNKLIADKDKEIENLTTDIANLQTDKGGLSQKITEQAATITRLTADIVALKQQHTTDITNLEQQHTTDITNLKQQRTADIADLEQKHTTAIADLEQKHTTAITNLKQQHTTDITNLEQQHTTDITNLKQQRTADIADLEQKHTTAIAALEQKLQERLDPEGVEALNYEIQDLNQKIQELKTQHKDQERWLEKREEENAILNNHIIYQSEQISARDMHIANLVGLLLQNGIDPNAPNVNAYNHSVPFPPQHDPSQDYSEPYPNTEE